MDMDSPAIASSEDNKWRAENDCDTLMRAEEIKADKKRFMAAMKIAEEKHDAMRKVMMATRPLSKGD